ncbi:MAG: FecR family protein [Cyanobacteria bacterium P01_C01_bin.120]
MHNFQFGGLAGILCLLAGLMISNKAVAQVPLTQADVEALQNAVELLPESGASRSATLSDRLNLGDAIRTAVDSRADLRFNDGSLARIGERATFWFIPDTRNFRLSNGTALFLVPPGRGPSTIETPIVVTGIQGTAILVRHIAAAPIAEPSLQSWELAGAEGRTIVMALTNNPNGPVKVEIASGQAVFLAAGQMAIATRSAVEVFEFDLRLFYETSLLVEGLYLDDPNYPDTGLPIDAIRRETLDGLSQQTAFVGDAVLDSEIVTITGAVAPGSEGPMTDSNGIRQSSTGQGALGRSTAHIDSVDNHLLPINRPPAVALPAPSAAVLDAADESLFGQEVLLPNEVSDVSSDASGGTLTVPTAGVIDPTTVEPVVITVPGTPTGSPPPITPIPSTVVVDGPPTGSDTGTPGIVGGELPTTAADEVFNTAGDAPVGGD